MHTVINEELRIQACSIADLTQEQKENIAADLQAGIEELSMIYDPDTDTIILNQDHENYELYKLAAETFMRASSKRRSFIMSKIRCYGDDTNDMLDQIARRRERRLRQQEIRQQYATEFKLIGNSKAFWEQEDILKAIDATNEYGGLFALTGAYNWGYIQGKRAERARRKKVAHE